jgi:hypothetical protein
MKNKDMRYETAGEETSETPEHEKHEIESAADTLTKAEEIKSNKTLHACAIKHLQNKASHMSAALKGKHPIKRPSSLADLRALASKKSAEID